MEPNHIHAIQFLQACASNNSREWLQEHGAKLSGNDFLSPEEVLAIAKIVCTIMEIVCPLVNTTENT